MLQTVKSFLGSFFDALSILIHSEKADFWVECFVGVKPNSNGYFSQQNSKSHDFFLGRELQKIALVSIYESMGYYNQLHFGAFDVTFNREKKSSVSLSKELNHLKRLNALFGYIKFVKECNI